MASGKIKAVITTRNSDNPSTPTDHETPQPLIHTWLSANWNAPADAWSNSISVHTASPADPAEATSATSRKRSGRVRGISSITSTPAAGISTSAVSTGNEVEETSAI